MRRPGVAPRFPPTRISAVGLNVRQRRSVVVTTSCCMFFRALLPA
jgi:hypothetical protein